MRKKKESLLSLRKVRVDDAPLITKWYKDKDNVKYMSTVVRCMKNTSSSLRKEIKESDPKYERVFMVLKKSKKTPIGQAGIDELDLYDKRGEVFFLIGDQEEQGKGYGKEILKLLLKEAFEKLKLHSLFATATVNNIPSIKTLEKMGFKRIGIRRDFNLIDGKYLDEILFDLTLGDYKKVRR